MNLFFLFPLCDPFLFQFFIDAKLFFKFLISILRFNDKLEKNSSFKRFYRNYSKSREMASAASCDEKIRGELK